MTEAGKLRAEFDGAFAAAPEVSPNLEQFIAIRVGTAAYVVPLAELRSIARLTSLTPAPSSRRELIGLVPVRGAVVAVFDLAPLIGHPPQPSPRWLVMVRDRLAFAVDHVDGYIAVPRASITADVVDGAKPILRLHKIADSLGKET